MDSAIHLAFHLSAGSHLAVGVAAVRGIVRMPALAALDEVSAAVSGAFNFHGRILPVLDLQMCLGRPFRPYCSTDAIIVLEHGPRPFGIAVEGVDRVLEIPADALEPPAIPWATAAPDPTPRSLIAAHARIGDDILAVLDVAALAECFRTERGAPQALPSPSAAPSARFAPLSPADEALLRQRARALAPAGAPGAADHLTAVAVVVLGGERFGLPLARIREFAAIRQVAPVPGCPPHIVGNMNLRGDIVTLVDIRGLFNLPPTGAVRRAVIIATDAMGPLGVPIDDVDDVVYLRSADRKAVPPGVGTGAEAYLAEIASDGERTLPIVDINRVFGKGQLVVDQEV